MAKSKTADVDLNEFYPVHVPVNDNGTLTCAEDGEAWPCSEAAAQGEPEVTPPADDTTAAATDGQGEG